MIIGYNISAAKSIRNLNKSNDKVSKSIEKISSGLRINHAADDASGIGISEKMKAQLRGLGQAERNIQDGISLVQTADSGLSDILDPHLQRLRELAVQASNSTYNSEDRQAFQAEVEQIKQSINNIANNTTFNGVPLLNVPSEISTTTTATTAGFTQSTPPTQNNGSQSSVLDSSRPVDSMGRFNFRTIAGYPTTTADDNQILIYGGGSTSYPSVRINGNSYYLNPPSPSVTITPTVENNGVFNTVFNIDSENVQVTQSVQITGEMKDKYEVKYSVVNNSSSPKNIGVQFNIDTELGSDDSAPFIVNGNKITNETLYTGNNIPSEFTVYNSESVVGSNPQIQANGILEGTGIIENPSRFGIGHWTGSIGSGKIDGWDFSPTGSLGDSSYSVWWDERPVPNGGTFEVNTFYGLSVPPTIENPIPPTNQQNQSNTTTTTTPTDLLLQIGANQGDTFPINRTDARTTAIGIDKLKVDPIEEAEKAISKVDDAISQLSSEQTKWGSYQNALTHFQNQVSNSNLNLTLAESNIEDVDVAKEVIEMTKGSVLAQTSQVILGQSNHQSQAVLDLLREQS